MMLMCELRWEQSRISFFTLFKFTLMTSINVTCNDGKNFVTNLYLVCISAIVCVRSWLCRDIKRFSFEFFLPNHQNKYIPPIISLVFCDCTLDCELIFCRALAHASRIISCHCYTYSYWITLSVNCMSRKAD